MSKFHFKDLWVATAIQQKEEHYGPLEDQAILVSLLADSSHQKDTTVQFIRRAHLLAQREGLLATLQQWCQAAKLALWLLAIVALFTGVGLAFSALDNLQKHVNILLALVALLGLHGVTLLLWVLSFFASWQQQSLLGKWWLWLSRKMARSEDALLITQSFIHTSNQRSGMRWIVSTISHGFWLIALCTATITWLALLAGKQFSFGWETTILSTEAFAAITHTAGFIPALLGFPMPTSELITQSSNHIAVAADAQKIWSVWLTGQLVIWGVLLRLICFLGCFFKAKAALASIRIDTQTPSYLAFIQRLQNHQRITTDRSKPDYILPKVSSVEHPQNLEEFNSQNSTICVVGIDLPSNIVLPNILSAVVRIESREDRHQLLAQLSQHPVPQLLIICDGTQTPDRGMAYFIQDISQYAQKTAIYLHISHDSRSRLSLWQKALTDMGIEAKTIWHHPQQLTAWLNKQPIQSS